MPLNQNDPFVQEALKQGVSPADIEAYLAGENEKKQHEAEATHEVTTQATNNPLQAEEPGLAGSAITYAAENPGKTATAVIGAPATAYGIYKTHQTYNKANQILDMVKSGQIVPNNASPASGPIAPVEPGSVPTTGQPTKVPVQFNNAPAAPTAPTAPQTPTAPNRMTAPNMAPAARPAVPANVAPTPPVQTGGAAAQEGAGFLERIAQTYGKVANSPYVKGVTNAVGRIAESPAGRVAGTVGRIATSPYALGAQLALTPSSLGPAVPSTGPQRGNEINTMTGRPWTPQELQQYNAQYPQ